MNVATEIFGTKLYLFSSGTYDTTMLPSFIHQTFRSSLCQTLLGAQSLVGEMAIWTNNYITVGNYYNTVYGEDSVKVESRKQTFKKICGDLNCVVWI